MFSKGPSFFVLLFVNLGLYFAPARGSPASVSDHVMTSQEYKKIEHVRTWLLTSSVAKFEQFWSEGFFQFLFSLILTVYEGLVQLTR